MAACEAEMHFALFADPARANEVGQHAADRQVRSLEQEAIGKLPPHAPKLSAFAICTI